MSSCNQALSPVERQAASLIYQALLTGKALIEGGERQSSVLKKAITDRLATSPLIRLDYVAVCDPDTILELEKVVPKTMLAVAVHIGGVRLIDNVVWLGDRHWIL
jgi:pantothenate synthetase